MLIDAILSFTVNFLQALFLMSMVIFDVTVRTDALLARHTVVEVLEIMLCAVTFLQVGQLLYP